MKNLFAALVLAVSTSVFAGPTVGLAYDIDVSNDNPRGFGKSHELRLSVAQETKLGTVDAVLLGTRFQGVAQDDANGFELGYSNGLVYRGVGISGRAAYGRFNQIDPNGGGFTGNSNYLSLGIEGQLPITSSLSAFTRYRHRNSFGGGMFTQNRYTIGVDYAVTKSIEVRAGYAHTRQAGLKSNGLTTAISYSF